MGSFMLMAHSGWRYIVLLALIVAIVKYAIGFFGKGKWSNFDGTLNRIVPIVVDIQFLLGIITYVMLSSWTSSLPGVAYWHPLTMTAAVVVAHVFSVRVKKATVDNERFQSGFIGYLLTLLLIALGVYFVLGGWNLFGSNAM